MILFFICFVCLLLAIPVLYVLLNDKEAHTYKLLFRALKSTATEMKMKFEPDKIISDFESGFISTVKKEVSVCLCAVRIRIYFIYFLLYFCPFPASKYNSSGLFISFVSTFNKEIEKIWFMGLLQNQ